MAWEIAYYNEHIKKDVLSLPTGISADYRRLIGLMEKHGADLRMPLSRALGKGLFELRPKGREGIARFFYCAVKGKTIIILHCSVKKTQKTPHSEMDTARRRLKEVLNG